MSLLPRPPLDSGFPRANLSSSHLPPGFARSPSTSSLLPDPPSPSLLPRVTSLLGRRSNNLNQEVDLEAAACAASVCSACTGVYSEEESRALTGGLGTSLATRRVGEVAVSGLSGDPRLSEQREWNSSLSSQPAGLFSWKRLPLPRHPWSPRNRLSWPIPVLDPRSSLMQLWKRVYFISSFISISLDPCFLYILTIDPSLVCVTILGPYAILLTILRSITDLLHLLHLLLQTRTAYISKESLVLGLGDLVTNKHRIWQNYWQNASGLFWDFLVMLPLPQILLWGVIPGLMQEGAGGRVWSAQRGVPLVLLAILLQYLPKVLHTVRVYWKVRDVSGYVFGTAWAGFGVNLAAYLVSSHLFGAIWYNLGSTRMLDCIAEHCHLAGPQVCDPSWLTCANAVSSGPQPPPDMLRAAWSQSADLATNCLTAGGSFRYGIYSYGVPVFTDNSWAEKVVYGLFFGLMTLSSFGNALIPSTYFSETVYAVIMITSGLLLFMLLVGNIQVFLNSLSSHSKHWHLRKRDMELWMERRQLPSIIRERVLLHERHVYVATRGVEEEEMLEGLSEGLRRDIKRHLCLALVKRVPLFALLDDIVLDNICDRLKHTVVIEDTQLIREGEPVRMMLFIIRGELESIHRIGLSRVSKCILRENNHAGEELLSWGLSGSSSLSKLPMGTATLTTLTCVEAFCLKAEDLLYVMSHFETSFRNRKVRRWIKYYSPHWRTWAAVNIQLAWRRYKAQKAMMHGVGLESNGENSSERVTMRYSGQLGPMAEDATPSQREQDRIRLIAAIFRAPKPHD